MNGSLLWILILAAGLAVLTLTPGLARRIILLLLGEKGRAEVGQKALSSQPDRISLTPRLASPGAEAQAILAGLTRLGFSAAGSFAVAEMGGLPIHFMIQSKESAVAAVYEHPKAGVWPDLFGEGSSSVPAIRPCAPLGSIPPPPTPASSRNVRPV